LPSSIAAIVAAAVIGLVNRRDPEDRVAPQRPGIACRRAADHVDPWGAVVRDQGDEPGELAAGDVTAHQIVELWAGSIVVSHWALSS